MSIQLFKAILSDLQTFAQRDYADAELVTLQEAFSFMSDEELLVAVLEQCPTVSQVERVMISDCREPLVRLDPSIFRILPSGLSRATSGDDILVRR